MSDFQSTFLAVLLISALIPASAGGQARQSSPAPDQFEFGEGHAYMGSDTVKWKQDRLVYVKRVADMSGKGGFDEKVERLNPTLEEWERFWRRIETLGVWKWKSDYSDPKRSGPDGESWALSLRHGAREVKSKGYNAVPETYSEFREAVYKLMGDARSHGRE